MSALGAFISGYLGGVCFFLSLVLARALRGMWADQRDGDDTHQHFERTRPQ